MGQIIDIVLKSANNGTLQTVNVRSQYFSNTGCYRKDTVSWTSPTNQTKYKIRSVNFWWSLLCKLLITSQLRVFIVEISRRKNSPAPFSLHFRSRLSLSRSNKVPYRAELAEITLFNWNHRTLSWVGDFSENFNHRQYYRRKRCFCKSTLSTSKLRK